MHTNPTPEAPRKSGRRPLRLAALGLSSAAVVGLLVGMNHVEANNPQPVASSAVAWAGYADLIEQVMPSVVAITVTKGGGEAFVAEGPRGFGQQDREMFERFMERFFGERGMPFDMPEMPEQPRGFMQQATGSGFVVDADGLIVTNYHVVDGAEEVTVKFDDGDEVTGQVVGGDRDTDLALVKVDTDKTLQAVSFADSDAVRVGDPVIAIGSPFGLGGTVTAGIVSADHRSIGAGRYDDFLQIDAPINRGNSGGPAFNLDGKVIGVNTAIHSPTGGNVGIGFAIPANLVVDIIEDLEDDGVVERGWLGVHIQGLDEDLAASLGLEEPRGALVARVMPDTPAAAAGFEQGDVILSFDGQEIDEVRALTRAVAETDPGKQAEVVVWRDGERKTFEVAIGKMPGEDQMAAASDQDPEGEDTPRLGVALARLTDEARQSLDLPADTEGVVVTQVMPGSPAAEKGLRRGDVIVKAENEPVTSPEDVSQAVEDAAEQGKDAILLLVKRGEQDRFVAVRLTRA